jgi:signal transduction histidine kinase
MLNRLRTSLTLLYLLIVVVLIAIVGAGSYFSLLAYFQNTTDLALRVKMAYYFRKMEVEVPDELLAAERKWGASSGGAGSNNNELEEQFLLETFEGELASVFVFPLNQRGDLLYNPNPFSVPFAPDREAAEKAWLTSRDLRTLTLPDQTKVRLLTYRVDQPIEDLVLQIGRSMGDQYRVLNSYLMGFIAFGGFLAVLMGLGSWWLAGKSLQPAQRAWQNQQEFVANASHELRAPVTLIHSSAEVALRSKLDGEARSLLEDIVRDSNYMARLVEDLLLLSRLDHRQIEMAQNLIDLTQFLQDIRDQTAMLAGDKRLSVSVGTHQGKLLADEHRLRQVLLILAENAVHHTPAGGEIRISSKQTGEKVEIWMQDSGEGIDKEHLTHIFNRFYRADHRTGEEQRGSGLGLAIAKAIVELQGGKIQAFSEAGKGTRIVITMPDSLSAKKT